MGERAKVIDRKVKVTGGTYRMIKARLGKKSQMVLPKAIVEQLGLSEGAEFEVHIQEGTIVLKPLISIPASQALYWTEQWQAEEREADSDVAAGRTRTIQNKEDIDRYFADLDN